MHKKMNRCLDDGNISFLVIQLGQSNIMRTAKVVTNKFTDCLNHAILMISEIAI